MFAELEKYKTNGHFFFEKNDNLRDKSKDVPNLPGVYYILKLAKGKVELVYIGKSGSMLQNGQFKDQLLNNRLNNKQDGIRREYYLLNKIEEENIEALDIYWFVTVDDEHNDLPGYVEGLLLQRYFEVYGCLPPWNKSF
ncbi:hypothetical protein IF125_03520 [Empedobacter stercoris]|uniref:hypothetical protein n=1 Tax=Empedobacter stercoris TaxID=1628248 RepID=UPI001CE22E71|nr:hypothetical protein [Empedobacter stercoris]MCA4781329.1 hypothetical protein [Empedobacter stercoris]